MENEKLYQAEVIEETVKDTENKIEENINQTFKPRNRAERRAVEKASKKKNKNKQIFMDNIQEATKRLTYARLIQRLREINEKGEKENEATEEGNTNL